MPTDKQIDSPSDFLNAIEASMKPEAKGEDKVIQSEDKATEPTKEEIQEVAEEALQEEEDSEEQEEKQPTEQEEEDPEADSEEDKEELPENATEASKKAFSKMRKKLSDLKKELKEVKKPELGEEERAFLNTYKDKKEIVENSIKLRETLNGWVNDPKTAAMQFAQSFPDATKVILEAASQQQGNTQVQSNTVGTPQASDVETFLSGMGIDIKQIEEEESESIGKSLRLLGTALLSTQKGLSDKEKYFEEKQKELEGLVDKKLNEKENLAASKKAAEEVATTRSKWQETVTTLATDAGLGEKAVSRLWTVVLDSISEDYNNGKLGKTIQEIESKVDIAKYFEDELETLGITKKTKTESKKEEHKKPVVGTMKNMSTSKKAPINAPEIKDNGDFLSHIESTM
jgi:hypothetical protein